MLRTHPPLIACDTYSLQPERLVVTVRTSIKILTHTHTLYAHMYTPPHAQSLPDSGGAIEPSHGIHRPVQHRHTTPTPPRHQLRPQLARVRLYIVDLDVLDRLRRLATHDHDGLRPPDANPRDVPPTETRPLRGGHEVVLESVDDEVLAAGHVLEHVVLCHVLEDVVAGEKLVADLVGGWVGWSPVSFLIILQCSSQRQWQRAVLSQRSKHSCGFNYIPSTTSKENYIYLRAGEHRSLARTLILKICIMLLLIV